MRLLVAIAVLLWGAAAPGQAVRRIAVIAGNDKGGEGTRPLLYAVEDARKVHAVLTRLGNVHPQDALLVSNQDSAALLAALDEAERRSREARDGGARTELILYYSGHAKDGALRLNQTQLSFDALKARLAKAPADVRIGIFDSCRSGALTRTKGARKMPEFEVVADAAQTTQGLVILTSSTSNEDSQESDALGGSYFTHHLTSGLLGDADRSRDGRVTLEEAYAYAYERTVADTSASSAGAQHPTFAYDLAGNGDLVLTDVGARTEGLEFAGDSPAGVYYVLDPQGFVVAEVVKPSGEPRRIAVPPGSYVLRRRLEDRLRIAELQVKGGQLAAVDERRFRDVPFTDDPVKGSPLVTRAGYTVAASVGLQAFTDAATRSSLFPPVAMLSLELLPRPVAPGLRWMFDASAGGTRSTLRLTYLSLDYRFTEVNLGASLLWEPWRGAVTPFFGARAAVMVMTRQFDEGNVRFQSLFTLTPGLVAGLRLPLGAGFGLMARGRLNYLLYNLDGTRHLGFWDLGLMVTYEL